MKILIEVPSWIGDAVMATPAIENIINHFVDSEISIIGSTTSINIFKYNPKVFRIIAFKKQYFSMIKTSMVIGRFDLYFSFRNSTRSSVFKYLISSKKKYQFFNMPKNVHLVEKYNNFINMSLNTNYSAGRLQIINKNDFQTINKTKPLLGLNPGASYGSAKRWTAYEYARVAQNLSNFFNIIIFGGDSEKDVAQEVEDLLIEKKVTNYQNFAGKTNLNELIFYISCLDLLITGDSGPMHIAASYQIPTISIFGPTRDNETSPWLNQNNIILKRNLKCQPCMQRVCPLGHNDCMNLIKAEDVLYAINSLKLEVLSK